MTVDEACFPAVEQAGRLYRQIGKHKPETVWVLTSWESERLNVQQWLQGQRDYCESEPRGPSARHAACNLPSSQPDQERFMNKS